MNNKIKKKLIFALPCRNGGSRLYGKPIQFIDIDKRITVIEQLISCIRKISCVSDIVLGISHGIENKIFEKVAKKKSVNIVKNKEERAGKN